VGNRGHGKTNKEGKIRRKTKKTQRKSDKVPQMYGETTMALGQLIDSTEIPNPKEDFGQWAARTEREATEG
jgi:hypothetical protein